MNEKSFAELFALVHDATTGNVPSVQQDQVHKTMSDLISASPATTDPIMLLGYLAAGDGGGGIFIHDSGKAKADHDGGHVVDPGRAFTSHADFLVVSSTVGTGCWVRQTRIWTPEMWGATGDGTTNDSDGWNAFSGFLARNGGRGELSGHYLVPDADEAEINTTSAVEIEGLSETPLIDGHTDGTRLFELTMGGLSLRNVRLRNTTLFLTDKVSTQDFDHVILENVSFDNSTADVHSAALRLRKSGETVPVLGLFRAVNVRIEGGLGGIEIESAIERFHVDDYVCRNISVPDEPAHFNGGNMRNLGYASGLSLGFDDPEFVELTRHGHIGAVFIEGVQDDREQEAGGDIANVDGVRIHAFDVKFDSIHVRDVNSFSKVDCTALYLKAHRCRGDRFTAIDAGFHEGMLTLKGDRRIAVESKSPGFNVSINDVQLIGTQEGFSGRAGVFCGVDDIHIGRLYMENVGGQVEDPYDAGSRLTGHGALFHTAETDSTAKKRLHIGTIEAVDCTLDNANGLSIRAVELQGYAEMTVDRIILDGMSQGGGFTGVDGRMVLVGIGGNIAFDHCEIGAILERNSSFSSTSPTLVQIEVDAASSGNVIIRNAFVTSDQIGIGIETAGDNAIDVLDLRGGNLEAATSSRLNTSPQVPDVIRVNGVKGLADLPARDENDPTVSSFTGDGSETDFALSAEPVSEAAILVLVDGVAQHQPDYSLDGTTLEFASAPVNGAAIEVRDLSLTAIADAEAVATVANIATEVQTVAVDLNGANTIGAALTSASSAAASATAAAGHAIDAAADGGLTPAAQAGFKTRFGRTPATILPFDLGGGLDAITFARTSIGYAVAAPGTLESISANTPRFTHDPTVGEPLGQLLEKGVTNLRLNSNTEFYNSLLGVIRTTNAAVAPDGTTTAYTATETATTGSHVFGRTVSTATGVQADKFYCVSAFFRDIGANKTQHRFTALGTFDYDVSTADRIGWRWDFATETITPAKTDSANVHVGFEKFGDGWYRLWATGKAVTSGDAGLTTSFLNGPGGAPSYTGDTDNSVAVWGHMLEEVEAANDGPSSPVITSGSQVARADDVVSVDLSVLDGFRPDGFSMLAEVRLLQTDGTMLAIGTGFSAEIALELQSGDLHLTNTNGLDLTVVTDLSPGDEMVIALRAADGDFSITANGSTVVTNTSHVLNANADKMQLGSNLSGANHLSMVLRQVAFFAPLDDTELEILSTASGAADSVADVIARIARAEKDAEADSAEAFDKATLAIEAAINSSAQARFHNRFGILPAAYPLGFDLGAFDQLELVRDTDATAIGAQGGPAFVANNVPRLTHDPVSGEAIGLLLEPESTNHVRNSEDLTSTAGNPWFLGNNLTIDTGVTDPAGTNKAVRLTASTDAVLTTSGPYFRSTSLSGSFTNGVSSWWIRRHNGTGAVRMLALNNGHTTPGFEITGEIDGTWRRISRSGPPGGSFYRTGIAVLTAGDAVEVAFPQLEETTLTVPSSYIPTTGVAVTRDTELASVDLAALDSFRPLGFSMVVEAVLQQTDGVMLTIGFDTTTEIALQMLSGDLHLTGADSLDLTAASSLAIGGSVTIAVRVQADDVAISVNGATVVTESSHTMNGNADTLQLGADIDGENQLPVAIRQIAFFGPLDDATLESMSGS